MRRAPPLVAHGGRTAVGPREKQRSVGRKDGVVSTLPHPLSSPLCAACAGVEAAGKGMGRTGKNGWEGKVRL